MPGGEDSGPQSGFRFEELRAEPEPAPAEATQPSEASATVERRYAALDESHARVGLQLQTEAEFDVSARSATEERFGSAKDEPAPPMQSDGPPSESLKPHQHGQANGGMVEQTPFGPMYRPPQQSQGQGSEPPEEKKLAYHEDREASDRQPDTARTQSPDTKNLTFFEDKHPTQDHDLEH